jgi:hypothetical protein
VNFEAIGKYSDLNHDFLANLTYKDALSVVAGYVTEFETRIHGHVCDLYLEHNTYIPMILLDTETEFNISIHIRTIPPTWPVNLDGKQFKDLDHEDEKIPLDAWQYFNINYNDTNQNTNYYADLYSRLINEIVKKTCHETSKKIVVNIFSLGSEDIFYPLIKRLSAGTNYRFWLNTKAADTFYWLTKSDVLICAHSSLSWLASYLNKNPSYIRFPYRAPLSPTCSFFNDELATFKLPMATWLKVV